MYSGMDAMPSSNISFFVGDEQVVAGVSLACFLPLLAGVAVLFAGLEVSLACCVVSLAGVTLLQY